MSGLKTIPIANKIPDYSRPINRYMINLEDGRIMATIEIQGIPFESESEDTIVNSFNSLKGYFNQLAQRYGSNLGVWTHIVKNKDTFNEKYEFKNNFMDSFNEKYLGSFKGSNFYKTSYFITYVLKGKGTLEDVELELEELLQSSLSILRKYDCKVLDISDDGTRCKNIEFLDYLLNATKSIKPLTESKVKETIANSDWHFDYDLLEIRNTESKKSKYATFYELDGFPLTSSCGMWDFILKSPTEFILTQSMILMKSNKALKVIDSQVNLIESSDKANHELEQLSFGRDYVATGEVSFGDYHCSLAVFGDTEEEALDNGVDINSDFLSRGTILKRQNMSSQYSFLSMLPASKDRRMPSPRTTTNLVCGLSLHNYSSGKKEGNPIGDGSALMPLKTLSDTLFYFNLHASDHNKNVTGQKYAGHTLILGASGSGKTTLEGVICGYMSRFNPQIFAIDYNRSTELYMRAYGAEYFTIREGIDTGLNPFQLDDCPELRSFLGRLVESISLDSKGQINEQDKDELKKAIDSVMRMNVEDRSLSMLLQSIQGQSLRLRLGKWCRTQNGEYSWCFDSPVNKFNPSNMDRVGFDSTMLLEPDSNGKPHPASEPILGILFFLKKLMQKEGRLFLTIVEEFWMPANHPLTQAEMKKILKAGRSKSEVMILSSQSPEDAVECEIFAPIVQQTATKIYLPNPDADKKGYLNCNVSESEFNKIKALDKSSRTFLVKQSNISCFAKLDLHGFEDHLPIISGTDEDIFECEKIRKEYGNNPDVWIPKLQEFIRNK